MRNARWGSLFQNSTVAWTPNQSSGLGGAGTVDAAAPSCCDVWEVTWNGEPERIAVRPGGVRKESLESHRFGACLVRDMVPVDALCIETTPTSLASEVDWTSANVYVHAIGFIVSPEWAKD